MVAKTEVRLVWKSGMQLLERRPALNGVVLHLQGQVLSLGICLARSLENW